MTAHSARYGYQGKNSANGGTTFRLQRKHAHGTAPERSVSAGGPIPERVQQVLANEGRPLDPATRAFMQPRFGQDFSRVRVHTDAHAAESARGVDALAYTVGQHIVFAPGQYAPATGQGQQLLAHELAHVVQQHQHAALESALSRPGDAQEVAASKAAGDVLAGRDSIAAGAGVPSALQRQVPGGQLPLTTGLPGPITMQSQGETVLESFLNRMWAAQSKQEKPFRVTPLVRQGLGYIFRFPPSLAPTDYASTSEVINRLRGQIPSTLEENTIRALDTLPAMEKPLAGKGSEKPSGEPAEPDFGSSKLPAGTGGPPKAPEEGKGYDEAAAKAAEAAFEEFRKTKLGQELEKWGKDYVLSKEGIPFDILVAGGVLTFIAANDPKLPSLPEIPVAEGIKIKIDYSGRISDLPPLLRGLVKGQSEPPQPGKSETKIGFSVTFTFEALGEFAKSVGLFFAKAARWFADGVVKIGTVIGKAVSSIKRYLIATAAGAALGAGIGALAGGGVGALIGAGIGAAVGLGGALISHLFEKKRKP